MNEVKNVNDFCRFERSLTQSLRQQQDEAYEQSLKADQEKERLKELERAEKQKILDSIEAEIQAEQQKKEDIARLKIELACEVPSEPPAGSIDAISVVFKLPNGQRLERRFLSTHFVKVSQIDHTFFDHFNFNSFVIVSGCLPFCILPSRVTGQP